MNAISVVIALSMVSCEQPDLDKFSKETEIILKAEFADSTPGTRTTITDDSADPMPLSWLAGDAINVFFGNSKSSKFTTAVSGRVAEFSGSINGVVGGVEGATQENFLWGVYPYSSKTTCDGSSVIYTLPSVQTAVAGTFADDLYPAIARSQNFYMSFYNVCGGFRFKVSNPDIVKVTLKGNKGEALAGKAKITMDEYPVVEEILEGSTELTMTAPDGGCFEVGKYYYFVAYPIEFSEGLTITYHKEDSQADYVVSNAHTLPRNKFSSFTNRDAGLTFVKTDELYIDEYGVNHGPGVEIDGVVWAPVNCGYHETDYPWGKLYQWGRKYGQGYDASAPTIVDGPVSLSTGQDVSNADKFYINSSEPYNWCTSFNDDLWNSGTEENPVKTEYDPCPDDWRVPTYDELNNLRSNKSSWTTNDGQNGYWFSGSNSYSEVVSRVFFSAAGAYNVIADFTYNFGGYWSSKPSFDDVYNSNVAYALCFDKSKVYMTTSMEFWATGHSVRCVQE